MQTFQASSAEQTEALGARLALAMEGAGCRRGFVALFGEMGVGKTAFTRGFCRALGIGGVRSPTYTVVNEYHGGRCPVFHFDCYRIADGDELYAIGFEDYLAREGFCLCEWSENIRRDIPPDAVQVHMERTDGANGRRIEIDGVEL